MITEKEGNEIWKKMLNQKRYLTEKSFSNYLKKILKMYFNPPLSPLGNR